MSKHRDLTVTGSMAGERTHRFIGPLLKDKLKHLGRGVFCDGKDLEKHGRTNQQNCKPCTCLSFVFPSLLRQVQVRDKTKIQVANVHHKRNCHKSHRMGDELQVAK